MRPPVFRGKVEKGRIVLDNRFQFRAHLDTFEGKRVELVLREKTAMGTAKQHRYYRGVVLEAISAHNGDTVPDLNKRMKERFGVVSTSELSEKQFSAYIDKVVQFAAEFLEVVIPDPEKVDLEDDRG